jgi:hypothetical protein
MDEVMLDGVAAAAEQDAPLMEEPEMLAASVPDCAAA